MQTNHKLNDSLFIFALMILLFVVVCPLVQAQTSPNDITFYRQGINLSADIYTIKADGSNQTNLTNSIMQSRIGRRTEAASFLAETAASGL